MRPEFTLLGWVGLLLAGWASVAVEAVSPVVINEFMAGNSTGQTDEDGESSDWIELHNRSQASVSLDGWFLTDAAGNLRRWRLPPVDLPANGYLVVFASGKDRRDPAHPLHTNFRLAAAGEYLALVFPDGRTVAADIAPAFPPQSDDIAYGLGAQVTTTRLIDRGAPGRYVVPADDSLGSEWREVSYDDEAWTAGTTALGFASGGDLAGGDLYAYWPVAEGAGNTASNRVAGGTNGTLLGARWDTDPGRGTVLAFDGDSSFVSAGVVPRMGISSNFTWSFWYRQRSVRNLNAVILGNRSGGASGALQFIKFTPSHFEYYRDGNIGFIPHRIAGSDWHHLAVVKHGSSLNYYDNGVLVGSSLAGGEIDPNPLYWGGDPGAPGEFVDGWMDDLALWTVALSADQIRALHGGASPVEVSGLASQVATDLGAAMRGVNASVYLRIPFTVPPGARLDTLRLRLRYDDGFVAYLNGLEVARRRAPATVTWNVAATEEATAAPPGGVADIDLSGQIGALVEGRNILAIHGLNASRDDSDFLLLPELEATAVTELGWRYFTPATPGSANDEGYLGLVSEADFDRPHGFYDEAFTLSLTCATPGATIRYTTDGTEPGPDRGTVYVRPLTLGNTTVLRAGAYRDGYLASPSATRTYLFLDQVLLQTGAGLPRSWGNDWEMDPRVVNHPEYAGRIREDLRSLPVVCLAFDPEGFWGPAGIYTLTTGRGDEYERSASAELFFPDASQPGFQVNCGVQIVGGASRVMTPKHGLGLSFKARYGPTKLRYKFFEDSEVQEFDFLAFRPNFNMSWVRTDRSGPLNNANADGAERLHAIYVRDQFTKESQLAMGQVSAHERFVHLYLNGLYWGLYNPSERTDATFAASYFGGRKEDYDTIFSDPSTVARAHDGDKNAWNEMMRLARAGLASPEAYARIQEYLDVTNLADYMMLNFYCATVDWPWQNWNAARKREPGAQFKFFVWDAEYTLETPPWVPDDRTGVGAAPGEADSPARLYHELRSNPEWRLRFADRAHRHFFNGGALTTNQTIPRFLRLCDTIDRAIVGESARWGDVVRREQPYTRNVEWLAEKRRLLTEFFPQRTDRVVQQFVQAGLYPRVAAPVLSPPEGRFAGAFELSLGAPGSVIYYTTNGADPRLPGGSPSPDARLSTGSLVITADQQILARAWRTNTWSALAVGTYTVSEAPPQLTLRSSEIGAVVTWPAHLTDFVLESADNLSLPQWTEVDGVVGNAFPFRPVGTHRFYRLRQRGP